MPTDDLPIEVLRFISERIDSVPHLEALLILWDTGKAWDAREMSRRIYLEERSTQSVLLDLQRAGLAMSGDAVSYTFDARWPGAPGLMPQIALTYQRNVTRIATLIHNKASSAVREFARAFDLKKER
ncbi:MAG: hypothetical protein ABI859_18735 [Pseudomonadota bacterium]